MAKGFITLCAAIATLTAISLCASGTAKRENHKPAGLKDTREPAAGKKTRAKTNAAPKPATKKAVSKSTAKPKASQKASKPKASPKSGGKASQA